MVEVAAGTLVVVGIAAGILEERADAADLQDSVDLECQLPSSFVLVDYGDFAAFHCLMLRLSWSITG